MYKGLWVILLALISGCAAQQKSQQPDNYNPKPEEYFQAPAGYDAQDGSYD